MTKEVLITIKGTQRGAEAEGVDSILQQFSGTYHMKNGKHFIQYEEKIEGSKGLLKNLIKISSNTVVLTKMGAQQSQMIFDLEEMSQTIYSTPYGELALEIRTESLELQEDHESLRLDLEYALWSEGNPLSNNQLSVIVQTKE